MHPDRSQKEDARLNQEITKPPSAAIVPESEEGENISNGDGGNPDPTTKTPPEDPKCETKHACDGKPPELLETNRDNEDSEEAEVMDRYRSREDSPVQTARQMWTAHGHCESNLDIFTSTSICVDDRRARLDSKY